jgi:hypothetical protein
MFAGNRCLVRIRPSWGALLALFVLTGPELHAKAQPRTRCFALPHAAAADAEGGDEMSRHRVWDRDFDVYETSAIELDVHCVGQPSSELRVRLSLPNGDTYETLDAVPLTEPPASRGNKSLRSLVATARFPVAGTFITQYGLVGTWTARVCSEEASPPSCGHAVRFSLER